ncbi:hypothetical protein Trydic_g18349 [Trypoxylus dichotomus]
MGLTGHVDVGYIIIPLTPQESELHDALQNIIAAVQQNSICAFEDVTKLEFGEPAEPHDAHFVEESSENEENNYENIACVSEEGGNIMGIYYKTRTVKYWKSGEMKLHSLERIEQMFKKVKSYDRHANVKNVLLGVAPTRIDYGLLLDMVDGKLIHDMDLRQSALEAKEEIEHESFRAGHW